jgi:hypothetical protein
MIMAISVFFTISIAYFVFAGEISAQSEEKSFLTHSGSVIRTSGEILDPL